MNKYVADTMAFVLRLENRKLPMLSKELFVKGEQGTVKIGLPSMVIAELAYLSERKRIDADLQTAKEYIESHPCIEVEPLTFQIVAEAFKIHDIPELHDRLIAATARQHRIQVITNDPVISNSSHITTIWK